MSPLLQHDDDDGQHKFLNSETWLTSLGKCFPGAEAQVFGKPHKQA